MPFKYTGNPVGIQAPSAMPSLSGMPIVMIPVAGDHSADLWAQPLMTLADWVAFFITQPSSQAYGVLLRPPLILSSGTSIASAVGCRRARVRMVGGGGGGGGCSSLASGAAGARQNP